MTQPNVAEAVERLREASLALARAKRVHSPGHEGLFVEHSIVLEFQEAVTAYIEALSRPAVADEELVARLRAKSISLQGRDDYWTLEETDDLILEAADRLSRLTVPNEPTEAQIEAGVRELNTSDLVYRDSQRARDEALVKRIYTAMQSHKEP